MPTILVNLNPNTTPPTLIIPQADMQIPIPQSVSIQTITWQLSQNSGCVFVSGDTAHMPITWLGDNTPGNTTLYPDTQAGAGGVSDNGLKYTSADNNTGSTTQIYDYRLCALLSGSNPPVWYYTGQQEPAGTLAYPKIKNN